ncbi:FAD-dependent oxidoreductase [Candidatus Thorarchaeota archaeon]|nr:MAG: FAD-dependent oxidoreductase [Candidatus Thorarchaeota archaeon]
MNIVIVGYGPGGVSAAIAARMFDAKANITIITEEIEEAHRKPGVSLALEFPDTDELDIKDWSFDALEKKRIHVLSGTSVIKIDPDSHTIDVKGPRGSSRIDYDRLILATGGIPNVPSIPGIELPGVFTIQTIADTHKIGEQLSDMNAVAIIGAGFSGLETAERLLELGKMTHLIIRSRIMRRQLEGPMSEELLSRLPKTLIIHKGEEPSKVLGSNKVEGLLLADEHLEVDAAIFMTGVKPNVGLAKQIGLKIGELGGIIINERMETSQDDIYAVGDCVEMNDPLTHKQLLLPIGSVAARAGRQAGVAAVGGSKLYSDISIRMQYDRIFGTDIVCIGHSSTTAKNVGLKSSVHYIEDPYEFSKIALVTNENGVLIGGQVIAARLGARLGFEILDRVESGAVLKEAPISKSRHERLREYLEQTFGPIR